MLQRLIETTKWIWCFVILSSGPVWSPVNGVPVQTPPSVPATIEAQAKFFQDFFSVQLSPYNIEFGHVCEDPNTWEQRYEKKDFKTHRDMGKVRWGDKKGGYGEHYWDLNHAGHTDDHGSNDYDDGSYHEDPNDTYNESNEHSHGYETVEYNPDETTSYEENGRIKRAYKKINPSPRLDNIDIEREQMSKQNRQRQHKDEEQQEPRGFQQKEKERRRPYHEETEDYDNNTSDEEITSRPLKTKPTMFEKEQNTEQIPQTREKNHIVLIVNEKEREKQDDQPQLPEPKRLLPYEGGAGVRQPAQSITPTPSVPRLFFDPTTGHVVDRATGQAFVLQPIVHNFRYN